MASKLFVVPSFPRKIVAGSLALLMSGLPMLSQPPVAFAQNLPTLGDTEREDFPPLLERKLGDQVMNEIRRDPDYIDDEQVLEYLNRLGNTLVESTPEARGEANYDFFFFAVRDPVLNAFALPGGYVAVHSGLVMAAQTESELASVMGHEIGHVAQRHIARAISKQSKDSLIPLAAMVLAVLAARSSPDASMAAVMGGQGIALQRQLNFSRDSEREADRVGLKILTAAGFDTSGMVSFFGRLQTSSRAYSDTVPAFLRSHPLTTERIADIQERIRDLPYKQHIDTLDFHLIRARLRLLQTPSVQGLRDAETFFNSQLSQQSGKAQIAASKYGLCLIALKRSETDKAVKLLDETRSLASQVGGQGENPSYKVILDSTAIDIQIEAKKTGEAVKLADLARDKYPVSRGIAHQYADALIADGKYDKAAEYLRDQTKLYRQDPELFEQLGKVYSKQGRQAQQHLAIAQSYALSGALPSALDQLQIARKAPDATFYDQAVIDADERDWQKQWKELQEMFKK